MGYRVFSGVKQPGRGVDHPPPSSAEVKESVQIHLYSPAGTLWPVTRWPLAFYGGSWGKCAAGSSGAGVGQRVVVFNTVKEHGALQQLKNYQIRRGVGTSKHNCLCILFIMLTMTCFGHCGPSSGHKNVYRGKLHRVWSLLVVHILNFQRDLDVMRFIRIEL